MSFEYGKNGKLLNPSDGESIQLDFDNQFLDQDLQNLPGTGGSAGKGNRIKTITRRQSTLISNTGNFGFNSEEKFQRNSKRHESQKIRYNKPMYLQQ